jgi:hypothetical protein
MSKRLNDENNYPFYWLDELAEIRLNPEKTDTGQLGAEELQNIRTRLPDEFSRISVRLKNQAFSLYCSDQIKVVAGHYDQAIRLLQKQTQLNLDRYPKTGPLWETGALLLAGLHELSRNVHQRYEVYLPDRTYEENKSRGMLKLRCRLSTDQIGLILKAADDVKLIVSRSLSLIYKAIVPYLSTDKKEHLSWDAMRSSTYHPDEPDKEAAISALQQMIDKIRGYR